MTDFPTRCPQVYDRVLPGDLSPTHIGCTYLLNHEAGCSFRTLQLCDEIAYDSLRAARTTRMADLPAPIKALVESIAKGQADTYIELLLASLHDRKRTRRGTPGFERPRRTA